MKTAYFNKFLPLDSPEPLQIEQYYKWFRFAVTQWISVAQVRAIHRIHKAIELDKVRNIVAIYLCSHHDRNHILNFFYIIPIELRQSCFHYKD